MHTQIKHLILMMNSRLLQAKTKLADWRYPWFPSS